MTNNLAGTKPSNQSTGLLILRLFVGIRLIYGVLDNIISWHQMNEFASFLASHGFPSPLVAAVLSVYTQFIAGLGISFGFKTKFFSILMVFNFIVALVFVHLRVGDSIESMTPAAAILTICLALAMMGSGSFSMDQFLKNRT